MVPDITGFENLVSYERCKAVPDYITVDELFENLVSYERCKATMGFSAEQGAFENLVSYERCKAKGALDVTSS